MLKTGHSISKLERLAVRLEQDIRQRGLYAGDRYLTAPEAANLLDVSAGMAHRAMRVLAQRQMLVRRRNCGTFRKGVAGLPRGIVSYTELRIAKLAGAAIGLPGRCERERNCDLGM